MTALLEYFYLCMYANNSMEKPPRNNILKFKMYILYDFLCVVTFSLDWRCSFKNKTDNKSQACALIYSASLVTLNFAIIPF